MNLFNLFAKISLDDKDFDKGVDNASRKGKGLSGVLSGVGSGVGAVAGAMVKGVAVASTAVAGFTTLAVKQYADYEQLVGGVETLFKDSSNWVFNYANNAYKTAGMSANQYMETITGFSASLLQGLGGDTKKASEIGNKAVTDMSDNANKMGTGMDMIQNAYQGFAKQNFTMLDNLKLGFGGTKGEMERLLQEATKLSGVEYSIGNFADIIEAIHVVQTEMGITGTTAKEASETIGGSFNAMKSTWANLSSGMANEFVDIDDLFDNFIKSVGTFAKNVMPRVEIVLRNIGDILPQVVDTLLKTVMTLLPQLVMSGIDVIKALITGIMQSLPMLISSAVEIITNLSQGIQTGLPAMMESAFEVIMALVDGIVQVLPLLLEMGLQTLMTLGKGIASAIPNLIPVIIDVIISLCDMIIENLPMVIDTAIEIIMAIIQGLITALPTLIKEVPRIINSFADAVYSQFPKILKAGIDILLMLIKGIIDSIPTLIANIPQIIMAIVNVITLYNWSQLGKNVIKWLGDGISAMKSNIGNIAKGVAEWVGDSIKNIFTGGVSWGRTLITNIGGGFSSMTSWIVSSIANIGRSILSSIGNVFSGSFNIGRDLIKGIWSGISSMTDWIMNLIGGFAGTVVKGIKDFFKIKSPSRLMRDEVGNMLAQGIGVGFEEEMPSVNNEIQKTLTSDFDINPTNNKPNTPNGLMNQMLGYLKIIADKDFNVDLDGRSVKRGLAPYQEEDSIYNSREARLAY